ncbi:hypothetical protein TREMEDRAFT_64080 [Tremella mesenterica DSM 1558]|uniref:uncharacterized protein n=1 Tax=Tremella mesenterica (strain ATCC 24925 / CBS 8224 / DSM 1558 / NBRC 9311 / NRRL Y-6157 / RJB 2259-6 / UBC 559-6) TaxID=578456 RepID=UPI0003F49E16|nr:uncharacterized protein TREMEDRAFT_64080 [Tremella mesenterica DSM 1558]EIW67499.1 hypothetical protein TREMEDRAFT_64080 [Tremella mesenterica DSM 1558]
MVTSSSKQVLPSDVRPLSLHEQFSLCRRHAGYPNIISVIVAYPTVFHSEEHSKEKVDQVQDFPSEEYLKRRIDQLQDKLPILHSRLRKGCFEPGERWSVGDILRREVVPNDGLSDEQRTEGRDTKGEDGEGEEQETLMNYLIEREIRRMERQPLHGPMWQVTLFTRPSTTSTISQSDQENQDQITDHISYLTLSVFHELIDGRGILHLLSALLSSSDIKQEPFRTSLLEETHYIKPPIWYILPIAFQSLLLPLLPEFVQRYFEKPRPWPKKTETKENPLDVDWTQTTVGLSENVVNGLKVKTRENGVTLHSVFTIGLGWALRDVMGVQDDDGEVKGKMLLHTTHPKDERSPTVGHSAIVGNYVSHLSVDFELPLSSRDEFRVFTSKSSASTASTPLTPSTLSNGLVETNVPVKHISNGEFSITKGLNLTSSDMTPTSSVGTMNREDFFWESTRQVGIQLKDDKKIREGRWGIGLLEYVPKKFVGPLHLTPQNVSSQDSQNDSFEDDVEDGRVVKLSDTKDQSNESGMRKRNQNKPILVKSKGQIQQSNTNTNTNTNTSTGSPTEVIDYDTETGWETFFISETRKIPFSTSISNSNLGFYTLPPYATDLIWGSSSTAFGPALNVSIIGHERGVRVGMSCRLGAALGMDELDGVGKRFKRMMSDLAGVK